MASHRVLLTNYLSEKALVIHQETVILIFRLLTPLTMESILLDIKELIWSKLDIKLKGHLNIESFKKNIRKKDRTSLLSNNNSCCNLCSS